MPPCVGLVTLALIAFSPVADPAAATANKSTATKTKTAAKKIAKSNGPEVSPAGDIPDNQAFVPYAPPTGKYVVSVPEGWARTENGGAISFTDKLNTIRMETVPASAEPSVSTAISKEFPLVQKTEKVLSVPKASTVKRTAGTSVLVTYERLGAPNAVTGKTTRESVERYEFWRPGTEVILTLSGPVGADNVDPWKIVTNSFGWT